MHKSGNNTTIAHRQELKFRILRTAMPLFKKKGVKAVRMDDIASALSISKRTLYEVYGNKEDLLLAGVNLEADEMEKRLQDYAMTAENELDIVVTFFRIKFADLDNVAPEFIMEIEKYASVKESLRSRHELQSKKSIEFIRQCIENGFFVPNLNYNIIQDICDSLFNSIITNALYEKYSLRDIFYNFFIVLLRGYCTERGITLLDQYLRKSGI